MSEGFDIFQLVAWVCLLLLAIGFLELFGVIVIGIFDDIYEMKRRRDWAPLKRFVGFCAFLAVIAGLFKALSYLPAKPLAIGVMVAFGFWILAGILMGCVITWKTRK